MTSKVSQSDVISLSLLFRTLWLRKLIITCSAILFGGAAALYAANEPDIYSAEVITIVPANQGSSSLPNIGGALGGIVGLGGLSVGDSGRMKLEQVERLLVSRSFVHTLIDKYDMKLDLIAGNGWNQESNSMKYDDELYNSDSNSWRIKEPTAWRAYGEFVRRVKFETIMSKNMLVITVDHHSPYKAREWAESIINELNAFYRKRAEEEAQQSIQYLEDLMASTDFIFVREAVSTLLEEQIKTDMLVKARDEYAFETLSPAVTPESRSHPKRLVLIVIGVFLGLVVGVVIALVLGVRKRLSN